MKIKFECVEDVNGMSKKELNDCGVEIVFGKMLYKEINCDMYECWLIGEKEDIKNVLNWYWDINESNWNDESYVNKDLIENLREIFE